MDINLFPDNEQADTARVASRLAQAIERKEPCSMIVLGDGEGVLLWAGRGFGQFHPLSTLEFSAEDRRGVAEQLAAAISRADIICLPRTGPEAAKPYMGAKLREGMRLWGVQAKPGALIGDSIVEFYLMFDGWLCSLMENRKVLLIDAVADKAAASLMARTLPAGVTIYAPANWWCAADATTIILEGGLAGSAKALDQAANLPWKPDLCIIGAGMRAPHLCVEIAEMHHIPVMDIGCVMSCFFTPGSDLTVIHSWYEEGG